MNVRIEKTFDFLATAYLDGQVFANKYYISVEMLTNTMEHYEQNTALDRVRHMLYNQFTNALFIDDEKKQEADKFSQLGVKTVLIPGPPVDQLIGIMLFCKLNAVMEERLFITQLKIASDLGDHLYYLQDSEEDVGPFEYTGWWHESARDIEDVQQENKQGNVIAFGKKHKGWHSFGLDWDQSGDVINNIELVDE